MATPPNQPPVSEPWLKRQRPGFFLLLSFVYLILLVLILLARQFEWAGVDKLPNRIGDIIPLAIPWFGALGAVLISLYGVFDHNAPGKWDPSYAYWHLMRPFVGAVLGVIAFLIFVGFINASTTENVNSIPTDAVHAIPYLVIAFVVGFREDTFRQLIKRVIDIILTPGETKAQQAAVAISPTPVRFADTTPGQTSKVEVTVKNTGAGDLFVAGADAVPPGVELSGDPAFTVESDAVSGAVIPANGQATLTIAFAPPQAGDHTAKLTVRSNAGPSSADVAGRGT